MPRFLVFLALGMSVLGAIHFYLWMRLVRDTELPWPYRPWATAVIALLWVSTPLALVLVRRLAPNAARFVAWPAYVWLGLMFLLFMLVVLADLMRVFGWAYGHIAAAGPTTPERRRFFARVLAAGGGSLAVALAGVAVWRAVGRIEIKEVSVQLGRLPAASHGTTIVQITDLHVGPTIGRAIVADIVERTNRLAPDIIAITGDLVDGSVEDLRDAVAPLAELRARHGVFFVTGNHEYFSGAGPWIAELQRLGIRVLRNERLAIGEGEDGFDLAGVDDPTASRMGGGGDHDQAIARALGGRDPRREVVLLAHQPKSIHEAARQGVGLQLSGHTHGGQIWPWGFFVRLAQPYVLGLHRHEETQIYVSPGTGYWGPPMRLGTSAEITRITLLSPQVA